MKKENSGEKSKHRTNDVDVDDKVFVVVDFRMELLSLRMTRVNKLQGAVDEEFTFTANSNNVHLKTLSSVKDQLDDDLRFLFEEGDNISAIKTSPICQAAVK